MDPQSSQRIQGICIRSCCRNPKQFRSLSVETPAWGVQRSWWRLSRYTGWAFNWQMETWTRVSWLAWGRLAKWRIYCWLVWSWERRTQAAISNETNKPARVDWLQKVFKLETCESKRLRLEVHLQSTNLSNWKRTRQQKVPKKQTMDC